MDRRRHRSPVWMHPSPSANGLPQALPDLAHEWGRCYGSRPLTPRFGRRAAYAVLWLLLAVLCLQTLACALCPTRPVYAPVAARTR